MPIDPRTLPQLFERPDEPFLSRDIRDLNGGMVTKVHATALELDEAVLLENVILGQGCVAEKRAGIIDVMSGQTPTGPYLGLGRWNPPTSPQAEALIAIAQSGIFDWDGSSSWRSLSGGSFSGTEPVYFVQATELQPTFDTLGYFFQRGASSVLEYDGSATLTVASGAGSGLANSVPIGVDATFWLNRLWVAESGTNNGYIRYSLFGEPSKFDTSTGFLVNPDDDVMRIVQWFNSGIIVFQRNSIWALDVDQANFDDLTFDSTRQEMLNSELGCVAGKSVVQAGQDFFFLSRYGVMKLSKTLRDKAIGRAIAISDSISTVIDTINWVQVHKSRAVVFDRWYLLGVPTGSSTAVDTILAYDLREEAWTVFTGWPVGDFQVINFPSQEERLYFATATTSASEVYEVFDELQLDDDGAGIVGLVDTARYDFGTTDKKKTFLYVDVFTDASTGGTLEVFAAPDNEGFTLLGSREINAGQLTLPFILDPVTPPVLGGSQLQRDRFVLDQFEAKREMQFRFRLTGSGSTKILYYTIAAQAWEQSWE